MVAGMVEFSSFEAQIANRIAALRKERKMTLRKVAAAVGLSEAYMSRLENHKAPITVDNLARIADALSVRIEEFFAAPAQATPLLITRAGHGKEAKFRGRRGFPARLLAHKKRRKIMEPIMLEVSGAKGEIRKKCHTGQEFNFIVKGSCEFIYGGERFVLYQGDSAYFDADVPHAVRPLPDTTCQLLAVVASDEFSMHGDLMLLLDEDESPSR